MRLDANTATFPRTIGLMATDVGFDTGESPDLLVAALAKAGDAPIRAEYRNKLDRAVFMLEKVMVNVVPEMFCNPPVKQGAVVHRSGQKRDVCDPLPQNYKIAKFKSDPYGNLVQIKFGTKNHAELNKPIRRTYENKLKDWKQEWDKQRLELANSESKVVDPHWEPENLTQLLSINDSIRQQQLRVTCSKMGVPASDTLTIDEMVDQIKRRKGWA